MNLSFDGRKNPEMRAFVETLPDKPIDPLVQPFAAFRKTQLTYAAKVSVPFTVDTLEGRHTGKAGDYLAVGSQGEMYPIDAAIFEETYEAVLTAQDPE
jgi:hypothetical protein